MSTDAPTVEIRISVDRVDRRVLVELLARLLATPGSLPADSRRSAPTRLEEDR